MGREGRAIKDLIKGRQYLEGMKQACLARYDGTSASPITSLCPPSEPSKM